MKKIGKLLLIVTALFFANTVFAGKDNVTLNTQFINLTFAAGNPILFLSDGRLTKGPLIAKNGGTAQWSTALTDNLYGIGIEYPNSFLAGCYQGAETITLNPEIYKGDLITVVLSNDNSGNLVCNCTGSACDVSIASTRKLTEKQS